MLEIGLATESKQDSILNAVGDTKTAIEKLSNNTKRESTLLLVTDAGYVGGRSTSTMLGILGDPSRTTDMVDQMYAVPSGSSNQVINPYNQGAVSNLTIGSTSYSPTVVTSRMYEDGIMVVFARALSYSGSSNYNYSIYVLRNRGYNKNGLSLYDTLGVKHDYVTTPYNAQFQIFRKGNYIGVLHSTHHGGVAHKAYINYQFAFQFNISTRSFETANIVYNMQGVTPSGAFYYPNTPLNSVNNIDYGYVAYQVGTYSSEGKYKAVIKFDPVAKTITHTGYAEAYSSATQTYSIPSQPSQYPTTYCEYDEASETITYATSQVKKTTYKYNTASPSVIPPTKPSVVNTSTLSYGFFEGSWYGYSLLKDEVCVFKLKSDSSAYVYVGKLNYGFDLEDSPYFSHSPSHFGVLIQRSLSSKNKEVAFVDYTNDLKQLLTKAV